MGSMVAPRHSSAFLFGSVHILRQMIPLPLRDLPKRNPSESVHLGPGMNWTANRPELRKRNLIFG